VTQTMESGRDAMSGEREIREIAALAEKLTLQRCRGRRTL
jgi:hypothetical protein